MDAMFWFILSLLATALFSALSAAFSTLIRMDPQVLEDRKPSTAERLGEQWPREWALTMLLLPFIALTGTVAAGIVRFASLAASAWHFFLIWLALSVIVLVLGSLFRSLAEKYPVAHLSVLGWVYIPLFFLLYPLTSLMRILLTRFDLEGGFMLAGPLVSTREIQDFVETGARSELLDKGEQEMISSIIDFHDTQVREVMIPRIDVNALDVETPFNEALDFAVDCGHSRIPVFAETVDHILGILYSKDLLRYKIRGEEPDLKSILREPYFIPETKLIGDLLKRFQEKRQHMAVVVDEYGGTEGLVTLEDLIEEIVGEIVDEYDTEERLFEMVDENSARVDAKIDLEELGDLLGTEFEEGEGYESLGGLLLFHAGKILSPGDEVSFDSYTFRVESVQRQRIAKVILIKEGLVQDVEAADTESGDREDEA
jgi:putative hemolysin